MWVTIITIQNHLHIAYCNKTKTNKTEANSQTSIARPERFAQRFAGLSPIAFIQQGEFGF